MTGGMDNPVDVAFTPERRAILPRRSSSIPSGGRRDGFIHAIYGGVYGKAHGVLDGHPRTGDLMPVADVTSAPRPPSGPDALRRRARSATITSDNFFAALFNLHKVTRHVLEPSGATFKSRDSDFLVADNLDFHPTDVLEDADGSLLVVDTGGWYKLCCPTSQLDKPDVLGAIYRVSPQGCGASARSARVEDRRGRPVADGPGRAARRCAAGGTATRNRAVGQRPVMPSGAGAFQRGRDPGGRPLDRPNAIWGADATSDA